MIWMLIIALSIVYLLQPPTVVGQVWNYALWYGMLIAFMINQVLRMPVRFSAGYATRWAIRELIRLPLSEWLPTD